MPSIVLVPEEAGLVRRRWRRRLIAGLAFLALIAAILAARPAVRGLRTWHARHLAKKAVTLMTQQQWQAAAANIKQAVRLNPEDPIVLRCEARLLSATGSLNPALKIWRYLADKPDIWTADDRRDYATAALSQGEVNIAATQLKLLRETAAEERPGDWLLSARLAERGGDRITEGEECSRVLNSPSSTEAERGDAATLVLRNIRNPAQRATAWEALAKVSSGTSAAALQALLFFGSEQLNPTLESAGAGPARTDVDRVIQGLESHPLASTLSKLCALDLRMQKDSSTQDALIAEAISKAAKDDDKGLGLLCIWLRKHGRDADVLKLLPTERAFRNLELSTVRAEAMASLGMWKELEVELENPASGSKVDELTAQILLANCAERLGGKAAFENSWAKALELAAGDSTKLQAVGRAAERAQLNDRAESAYRAAIAANSEDRSAYEALLGLVAHRSGAREAAEVLTIMSKRWPEDPAIKNSLAYDGLLSHSMAPATAQTIMEGLVHAYPLESSYQATLALAYLGQGQKKEALRAFGESLDITAAGTVRPSTLAVHALVLTANDMKTLGRMELEKVNPRDLLPEEREMVAPVLNPLSE